MRAASPPANDRDWRKPADEQACKSAPVTDEADGADLDVSEASFPIHVAARRHIFGNGSEPPVREIRCYPLLSSEPPRRLPLSPISSP